MVVVVVVVLGGWSTKGWKSKVKGARWKAGMVSRCELRAKDGGLRGWFG